MWVAAKFKLGPLQRSLSTPTNHCGGNPCFKRCVLARPPASGPALCPPQVGAFGMESPPKRTTPPERNMIARRRGFGRMRAILQYASFFSRPSNVRSTTRSIRKSESFFRQRENPVLDFFNRVGGWPSSRVSDPWYTEPVNPLSAAERILRIEY